MDKKVKQFCGSCGQKLVQDKIERGFDEYSGEILVLNLFRCPEILKMIQEAKKSNTILESIWMTEGTYCGHTISSYYGISGNNSVQEDKQP